MKTRFLLAAAGLLALAGCNEKEPTPSNPEVTSAPFGPGARRSGAGRGGPDGGPGAGPQSPGVGAHMNCPPADAPLSASSRAAIERALADERAAEARYDAVVQAFGPVMPFRRLERAEHRHSWALEQLLVQHRTPVPPEATSPSRAEPKSLRDECALAVQTEEKNVALYDELMSGDLPADVRCVFSHLRDASKNRHLPALERCAGRR